MTGEEWPTPSWWNEAEAWVLLTLRCADCHKVAARFIVSPWFDDARNWRRAEDAEGDPDADWDVPRGPWDEADVPASEPSTVQAALEAGEWVRALGVPHGTALTLWRDALDWLARRNGTAPPPNGDPRADNAWWLTDDEVAERWAELAPSLRATMTADAIVSDPCRCQWTAWPTPDEPDMRRQLLKSLGGPRPAEGHWGERGALRAGFGPRGVTLRAYPR